MLKSSLLYGLSLLSIAPQLCNGRAVESEKRASAALTWKALGGSIVGHPGIISWAPDRTDIFVRGSDNAVYHKWQLGNPGTAWGPSDTGFQNLGGSILSDVTVVSRGYDRLDAFVVGADNACYHGWWNGSYWSTWGTLGGAFGGDISAVAWGNGRLDLFGRGMDNAVWHRAWDGAAWGAWESLGGAVIGSPKVVSWGANRLDVFARGTNNGVYHIAWNGSLWSGWYNHGGTVLEDITPVSTAPNRLDLFVRGGNNALYQKNWNGAA
ncbi:hypothetical protein X797_007936 [Metarhizium robertsii]|uniref:PLL-like beta propeller domain-containing protein n=2 Tax=Metarhizium robertsii TaxID=568076 RepID=E9F6K2_METRA|nr:uncharacterized protein MAA_07901 [Metarhizium robertsii ARSEF 23]EFY96618.1 hypothetical protein MAA_07901 [Metarhizium robertsii ARSEF 23]EXU98938.1 hypothetical protein X797_007936 [Metarhizium robertsii]